MHVAKGIPRDGAAVAAMQRQHDLVGGTAPHLDFRSLNGQNEGYGPVDRRSKPQAIGLVELQQGRGRARNVIEARTSAARRNWTK